MEKAYARLEVLIINEIYDINEILNDNYKYKYVLKYTSNNNTKRYNEINL